jgi:hypothetical protein
MLAINKHTLARQTYGRRFTDGNPARIFLSGAVCMLVIVVVFSGVVG